MARVESIPAVMQEQLDYFDMLVAEEASQAAQQQLQQQHGQLGQQANIFTSGSGLSTAQLWAQRSIGAVARKDLAKIAAMQSLAQQHSNSSTPTPGGLTVAGSLCLGSPWGSFTAGSSSASAGELQGAGMVRRVSSPAGHSSALTPRSNCSFTAGQGGAASMQDLQGMQLQLDGVTAAVRGGPDGSGSGWPSHLMNLPSDLGESCGEGPAGLLQHQQQLLMQASAGPEVMPPMLPGSSAGVHASGSFGSGDVMGRGAAAFAGSDASGMRGGAVPPPPPPPAQPQHGMLGAPPPPPPRGNGDGYSSYGNGDGRLSGSASPVPAPPPRALTPSGAAASGQVWGPSPMASPRFAGPAQQPQSPGGSLRPARVANRLFQPGMSNLGHNNWGGQGYMEQQGPGSGTAYPQQQQQQPMLPTGAFNQPPMQQGQPPVPPPYGNRAGSPVSRGLPPPPPPPPGMPPPGYAAASAAAAANGICGSPVPPGSPAGGRLGSGGHLQGMSSCPASTLESMASGGSQCMGTRSPCPAGPPPLASHSSFGAAPLMERPGSNNMAQQAAAGGMTMQTGHGMQQQTGAQTTQAAAAHGVRAWKADGSTFLQELLQLLRGGAAAGNSFLGNLQDLLECAVAAAVTAGANSNSDKKAAAAAEAAAKAAPVDAAAFLGLLQEAAAPLLAAAAVAAAAAARAGSLGRRGPQQRMPEASDAGASMGGGGSAAAGAGGARPSAGNVSEPGKGLKPIRTAGDRASSAGMEPGSDLDTPPALLLRQQLAGRAPGPTCSQPGSPAAAALQLLYPLHPRTTINGGRDAGGTPQPGTPMLLAPQTLPELLSARAALVRLMVSAHGFVLSQRYRGVASRLEGVAAVYDSMHDDPVVAKRRKCREMAAMRAAIRQDAAFVQAVSSLSSLRNHIYSLSRKVLIGYGHVEGLPVDLLLGGLTSELAAILTDPSGQPPPSMAAAAAAADRDAACPAASEPGGGAGGAAAAAAAGSRSEGGAGGVGAPQATLPQQVLDFFTCALPLPKLALLVFAEFVAVDPSPCCASAAASGALGGGAVADGFSGSNGGGSFGVSMAGASDAGSVGGQRGSNLRLSRHSSSSSSSSAEAAAGPAEGREAGGSVQPGERRGSYRYSRDGENSSSSSNHGRDRERDGLDRHSSGGLSRGGRGQGSFSSNGSSGGNGSHGGGLEGCGVTAGSSGGGSGKQQRTQRRSQHCEFDLVAEAAALDAAATAAAPLVAAVVCDLPTGRHTRSSSSTTAC
ncbi:hypothetical protein COO60DRAFT_1701967 [Scenedesmus sp. NREL 46B-D3]|nr:hypothetical protein COO60DRAFT_1701967 [Scenedesmus sp. NREL 46B-D3]